MVTLHASDEDDTEHKKAVSVEKKKQLQALLKQKKRQREKL